MKKKSTIIISVPISIARPVTFESTIISFFPSRFRAEWFYFLLLGMCFTIGKLAGNFEQIYKTLTDCGLTFFFCTFPGSV